MNDLGFLLMGVTIGAVVGVVVGALGAIIKHLLIVALYNRREKRTMKRLGMGTPRFCKTQWPEGRGE